MQGKIYFTAEELKGVPQDVVEGYEKTEKDGKVVYGVTHKTPDIVPVVRDFASPFYQCITHLLISANTRKILKPDAWHTKATRAVLE